MAASERVLTPLAPTSDAGLSAPRRAAILIAVLLGAMFAALDQLVVITAMPRVVADLGGLGQFAWVFTAYMLTSTVTLPIYGKLSDMYGRRPFWIAGLALFMLGSALAGASQAMIHLVLARAVQGLGAGALMALGAAIFGDLFPPSERGKWQGLLAAVFGLVFIAGPTLGGWITDNLSWRWIFYVNLPLGGIALAAAWIALPGAGRRTSHALDLRGALALVGTAVPLLLALGWAGTEFPWVSAEIIGLLAVGLVGLFALIAVERRAPEPIVNLGFLRNRVYAASIAAMTLVSFGLLGALIYIPLFVQVVVGASATGSGAALVPMMLGFAISALIAGQIMSRTGRYKALVVGLFAIAIGGALLLARMDAATTALDAVRNMAVIGLGIGGLLSVLTVVAQNAFPDRELGQISAGLRFFRSIGSTLGAAVLGALLTNRFAAALNAAIPPDVRRALPPEALVALQNPQNALSDLATGGAGENLAALGQRGAEISAALAEAVRAATADSIAGLFVVTLATLVAGLLAALFLREIPLRKALDGDRAHPSGSHQPSDLEPVRRPN